MLFAVSTCSCVWSVNMLMGVLSCSYEGSINMLLWRECQIALFCAICSPRAPATAPHVPAAAPMYQPPARRLRSAISILFFRLYCLAYSVAHCLACSVVRLRHAHCNTEPLLTSAAAAAAAAATAVAAAAADLHDADARQVRSPITRFKELPHAL
jgi:hypothetical protein